MQLITIMPDFGNGPYAWLKNVDDGTTLVGGNIADAVSGFEGYDFKVSIALEQAFGTWVNRFEQDYKEPAFDWEGFHREGIALSRRLKAEIGDQARVVYYMASEDPASVRTERTEVMGDGSLKEIRVVLYRAPPD